MATLREVSVGSKKVDCVAEQSLCRDMGIQGFPTVVLCDRGTQGGPAPSSVWHSAHRGVTFKRCFMS